MPSFRQLETGYAAWMTTKDPAAALAQCTALRDALASPNTAITAIVLSSGSMSGASAEERRVLQLFDAGKSTRQIEAETGIGRMTAAAIARRFGRPARSAQIRKQRALRDRLIMERVLAGENTVAIARDLGISREAVDIVVRRRRDGRLTRCPAGHRMAVTAPTCPTCGGDPRGVFLGALRIPEVVRLFVEERMSTAAIGARAGVGAHRVRQVLAELAPSELARVGRERLERKARHRLTRQWVDELRQRAGGDANLQLVNLMPTSSRGRLAGLSPRDRRVVACFDRGMTYAAITRECGIDDRTVRGIVQRHRAHRLEERKDRRTQIRASIVADFRAGRSVKDIAAELGVSETAIHHHLVAEARALGLPPRRQSLRTAPDRRTA